MKPQPMYIETVIDCEMETLWRHTQDPAPHTLWDLRFSDIRYLPRSDEGPQRFSYSTRIGFGISISGTGETVGANVPNSGTRSSALKFGSNHPLSLIRTGSGYWKYEPTANGIRFITGYDYRTRWGSIGSLFDRLVFRPLMRWATAWSFDRLKNWIERGIRPESAMAAQLSVAIGNAVLAAVWIHHGLVPKILFPEHGELALFSATGVFGGAKVAALRAMGCVEIAFGIAFLLVRRRWIHQLNIAAVIAVSVAGLLASPWTLAQPFDPATTALMMIALSSVALINHRAVPSASRCVTKATR